MKRSDLPQIDKLTWVGMLSVALKLTGLASTLLSNSATEYSADVIDTSKLDYNMMSDGCVTSKA